MEVALDLRSLHEVAVVNSQIKILNFNILREISLTKCTFITNFHVIVVTTAKF